MSSRTIWIIFAIAAVATGILISNLFQPSGMSIQYTAESYFEVRKLFFAAGVLAVLALLLMLSVAIYGGMGRENPPNAAGKDIFDSMIKVVPPIITLVLGYYFGQQSAVRVEKPAQPVTQQGAEPKPGQAESPTTRDRRPEVTETKPQQRPTPSSPGQSAVTPAAPASPASR